MARDAFCDGKHGLCVKVRDPLAEAELHVVVNTSSSYSLSAQLHPLYTSCRPKPISSNEQPPKTHNLPFVSRTAPWSFHGDSTGAATKGLQQLNTRLLCRMVPWTVPWLQVTGVASGAPPYYS